MSRRRRKPSSLLALALLISLTGSLIPTHDIKAAACTLQGNTITVSCDFPAGTYYYNGTFTVNSGVTVTAGNATTPGQVVIMADDFSIDGIIDANALGSASVSGSCPGASGVTNGPGACHGGDGGRSTGNNAGATSVYGSATAPETLGSGGGDDSNIAGQQGGAGGGAVKLATYSSTGTFSLASTGLIRANGANGVTNEGGGGAGGSIFIDVGTINVTVGGFFTANGGNGSGSGTTGGGGGGGGRIALTYTDNTGIGLSSQATAYGGARGGPTAFTSQAGGAGTVFVWDKDDANGDLLLDDNSQPDTAFTRQKAGDDYTFRNVTIRRAAKYRIPTSTTLTVESGGSITGDSTGPGHLDPELWLFGTLNAPAAAWTLSDIRVHHFGTMGVVRYLNYDGGIYSIDTSSALFSAGRGNRLESLTVSGTSGYSIFSASSTTQLFVDTLTVKSGGMVTHASNTTLASGIRHQLSISATTTISVESGGSISAFGKGYAVTEGLGAGADATGSGGGAYGGDGGRGTSSNGGTSGYGSISQPIDPGSGGGANGGNGNPGGGIIKLTANGGAGTITIDGTVGADGGTGFGTVAGGGSGGSVWIDVPTGTVAGSGTVNARGGNASTTSSGGGGGGRIAVHFSGSHALTLNAYGGNRSVPAGTWVHGGAGTIYEKVDTETNGDLTVDDNGIIDAPHTRFPSATSMTLKTLRIRNGASFLIPAGSTVTMETGTGSVTGGGATGVRQQLWIQGTLSAPTQAWTLAGLNVHHAGTLGVVKYLTYDSGVYSVDTSSALFSAGRGNRLETLTVSGTSGYTIFSASSTTPFYIDVLTVKSGGMVTHASNTTLAAGIDHQLSISATTTIDVQSGGSIDVTGRGYQLSEGPGAGSDQSGGDTGGGGYGGDGGRSDDLIAGGLGYGSITQPIDPGSGGGNQTFTVVKAFGAGGGIVKLTAVAGTGTITNDGTIAANGQSADSTDLNGGGAGGSVWVDMPTGTLSGSGTITANGGNGANVTTNGSGGGGGGRIAVYYAGSHAQTLQAIGGRRTDTNNDAENGGAGSVYEKVDTETNGDLTIDNDSPIGVSVTSRWTTPTSLTLKNFRIRDDAHQIVNTGITVTIEPGTGTLSAGGASPDQPSLRILGTVNMPSEAMTIAGLDVTQSGAVGVLRYLTYDDGTYSLDTSSSLFTAGRGQRLETLTVSGTSGNAYFSTSSLGIFYVDTLVVKSGGVITSASNTTTVLGTRHRLDISATTSVEIQSGGSANVTGKGFSAGQGTGTGCSSFAACGGAHGGDGGDRIGIGNGGLAYGSVTQPLTLGSGGGIGTAGTGGNGGGAVRIVAPTLTIDGTVLAESFTTDGTGNGSGAGGSVWLDATTLAGAGSISANSAVQTGPSSGGGGGGRIAVYSTTDASTITMTAYSSKPTNAGDTNHSGGAGTIYTKDDAAPNGDLLVANSFLVTEDTPQLTSLETYDNLTISSGVRYVIGPGETLTVAPGGTFTSEAPGGRRARLTIDGTFNLPSATQTISHIDVFQNATLGTVTSLTLNDTNYSIRTSTIQFTAGPGNRLGGLTLDQNAFVSTTSTATLFLDTLTMNSGSVFVHATNTGVRDHVLDISATTSITVNSGAQINLTARGHRWTTGPCKGTTANVASGAGHGGDGGDGNPANSGPAGALACDSVTQPIEPGSGGGDNTSTSGFAAGDGGGVLKLSVNSGGTITHDGTIDVNGTGIVGSAGGGAGGAVWIDAPAGTVSGSGSVSAVGGNAGSAGGGGGGGRVAVYYSGTAPSFAYDLRGGTGYEDGGAGTLYLKSDAQVNGSLIVDNEGRDASAPSTQSASNTSVTFDDIALRDGGHYVVPSGRTTTIASGGDCSSIVASGAEKGTLTVDGTFDGPSATCSLTGLNLNHNGTIGTITSLTVATGTYAVYTPAALWSAGPGNRITNLTLDSGGTLSTTGTDALFVNVLTANNGSVLRHASNTTASAATNTLYISATSSVTFASGSTINLLGRGYIKTEGPGQGADSSGPSGGAHGGSGGAGSISALNTATYDSAEFPSDLGSGGGDFTGTSGGAANSPGGGSIRLFTPETGSITIAANVSVNGGVPSTDGGGSAGSIWIQGGIVTITANLSADGSSSTNAVSGCGGGGRIAVYYAALSYSSGTATAATGCATARAGTTGSVYFAQAGEPPVGPTNGFTQLLPSILEVGQNIVVSASATDDIGVTSIEIYLDGTDPGNLVKTCTFSPAETPASCQYTIGPLSAGSHSITVKSYDSLSQIDTDTTNFTVAGDTLDNRLDLSTYKKSATATASLSFTLASTSTGTLTLTFPAGFTVLSAPTSGSGCLSAFGFTSNTMYATKTGCSGGITMTGGTVTNPSVAGGYTVTWTNDNGSAMVYIVDDDNFNISASVDPIITFNVGTQTGTCNGAFAGNGGTLPLGSLSTSAVATSDVSSVPHICTRLSTNAPGGAVVTVRSQNAALASVASPGDTIPSGTATLVAGTTGYGLCVGSSGGDSGQDVTIPVGATPAAAGPFGGSCSTSSHHVGGLTTSPQIVWQVNDPTQNAYFRIFIKAAIDTGVANRNDYTDVLTFIATGTY